MTIAVLRVAAARSTNYRCLPQSATPGRSPRFTPSERLPTALTLCGTHPGRGGVFYGTTFAGGSGTPCSFPVINGCGTVFQLTPPSTPGGAWTEAVLYSFAGENGDGAFPSGGIVVGKGGVLYGTTEYGGSSGSCVFYDSVPGCGTVFQLTPPLTAGGAWTETVLHNFSGENGDGACHCQGLPPGRVMSFMEQPQRVEPLGSVRFS